MAWDRSWTELLLRAGIGICLAAWLGAPAPAAGAATLP